MRRSNVEVAKDVFEEAAGAVVNEVILALSESGIVPPLGTMQAIFARGSRPAWSGWRRRRSTASDDPRERRSDVIERLKQAVMVLVGHRPAEVRYDDEDRDIAAEIAEFLARACVASGDFSEDTLNMMIEHAIWEYASWAQTASARAKIRTHFAERDRQLMLPF